MLSISPVGSGSGSVAYYSGMGQEKYFLDGGELPGTWWGTGAASLGLHGKVGEAEFRNLLRGYSPDGMKALVQNAGSKVRRAGFDVTASAVKSVSVAWSQGNLRQRLQIEGALGAALSKMLKTFDEFCGVTRRGHNGTTQEQAGLIAAIFRHDTARGVDGGTPDPQLHFHVVLLNAVVRQDGTTGALDATAIFRKHMKLTLGALFRVQLSKELDELGLTGHRPMRENGKPASWFELNVVPKKLIDEFSKRSKELRAWLRQHGLHGGKAAEVAAVCTRWAKKAWKREDLVDAWKKVGAKFGFGEKELEREMANENTQEPVPVTECVQKGLRSLMEGQAYFSELELLCTTAVEAQCQGVGIDEVKNAVSECIGHDPELVELSRRVKGEIQYTTKEMLRVEAGILDAAERGRGSNLHGVSNAVLAEALREFPTIKNEQREAVRHITEGRDSHALVNGFAGTGKTFMLSVARVAWERAGFTVLGTSLAAKASKGLEEESGIESVHIHRLLWQIENGKRRVEPGTILVVDEAGMVGTRQLAKLVDVCEAAHAKMVLVGDRKQLQAIEAGAPFAGLAKRLGHVEMKDIIRQKEVWGRDAVLDFAEGRAGKALKEYQERGLLEIADDHEGAMEALAKKWFQVAANKPEDSLVFAGTHLEVSLLNRMCQAERIAGGVLPGESVEIGNDEFFVGDRVLFKKNCAALMVQNGTTGTIQSISKDSGRMRVLIDGGAAVLVDTKSYDQIRLGYAITVHAAQGITVDNGFVLVGSNVDQEMAYVESSRARLSTRIYADVATGGEDIQALARLMSNSRPKELAHELMEGA